MKSLLLLTPLLFAQPDLQVHRVESGRVEVRVRLAGEQLPHIPAGKLDPDLGESWLRLGLVDEEKKKVGPPLLGNYQRDADDLIFRSRLPLDAGRLYDASFGPAKKPLAHRQYRVPEPTKTGDPPRVVKIYPSGDVLPANHLKFYIYFSNPMRGGADIFKLIEIQDADGNVISDAWLIDELWDETGRCLILYIHPGRIKWGVELRELLGPVLEPRRRYRLMIRREIEDSTGLKLAKDVVKTFSTIDEDRVRIDVSAWKIQAPAAGSKEALRVDLGKALDHKGLQRFVRVTSGDGRQVAGKIEIGDGEKTWRLVPERPWESGEYQLRVDGQLEDVAGNTPERPFDLDLSLPRMPPQKLERGFRVR